MQPRRRFLDVLLKVGSLLTAHAWLPPFAQTSHALVPTAPVIDRVLGRCILPGHASTVMLVGSNLPAIERVRFAGGHLTAQTLEQDRDYVLLRVRSTDGCCPAQARMRVHLTMGGRLLAPAALLIEEAPSQIGRGYGTVAGSQLPYSATAGYGAAQRYGQSPYGGTASATYRGRPPAAAYRAPAPPAGYRPQAVPAGRRYSSYSLSSVGSSADDDRALSQTFEAMSDDELERAIDSQRYIGAHLL